MARKSRRNTEPAVPQAVSAMFRAGAYVRLSAVDRKKKGDSIENQQAIVCAYIAERPDLEWAETYIDNGTTGQTFERPAFQRMLADLESGRINCCITKDLSRLGRNAIDTGYYIEKYFPARNIRYIAVTDNYDSADGNGGVMVSLKNMVNEAYAIEIGRKVHTTRQININSGCFVGGFAPYGYLKDPKDGHKLIPDPYASAVVRSIFEMFAGGQGVTAILNHLNAQKIMPPNLYRFTRTNNTVQAAKSNACWTNEVIYEILRNRIYTGDMVQGRSRTRQHTTTWAQPSEWVVTENTHEPVVTRELFDAVQNRKGKAKYSNGSSFVNIFAKKLYCGHCGYAIHHERRKNRADASYFCTSRKAHGKDACVPVPVSTNGETLKKQVLEKLRGQAEAFAEMSAEKTATAESAGLRTELDAASQELVRVRGFLKGLYESLIEGDITNDEYTEMKRNYESRIAGLSEREKNLSDEISRRSMQDSALKKAKENIDGVSVVKDLTAEVLDAVVERILLFEDKRIEVTFKYHSGPKRTGGGSNG